MCHVKLLPWCRHVRWPHQHLLFGHKLRNEPAMLRRKRIRSKGGSGCSGQCILHDRGCADRGCIAIRPRLNCAIHPPTVAFQDMPASIPQGVVAARASVAVRYVIRTSATPPAEPPVAARVHCHDRWTLPGWAESIIVHIPHVDRLGRRLPCRKTHAAYGISSFYFSSQRSRDPSSVATCQMISI